MTENTEVQDFTTKAAVNVNTSGERKVDIVLIDGYEIGSQGLSMYIRQRSNKNIDIYDSVSRFLKVFLQYPKDTKFCMGYVFWGGTNGIALAKKLHEAGYNKLYLYTGWGMFKEGDIPDYLTFVPKLSEPHIADVLLDLAEPKKQVFD